MAIEDIINNIQSGNNTAATNAFEVEMNEKIRDSLESKKIEVAAGFITQED